MTKSCDLKPSCNLILGIDGGGTKTAAFLAEITADGSEQILGQGHAGSSNFKAVGTETALANLEAAIGAAWQDVADKARQTVALAVFGLSGAGRPETQSLVHQWCTANAIAAQSRVVHDALPVLVAGTSAGQGVALIAGTGAVAYAVNHRQESTVVGGWGYWFGDEGSAFWLGQSASRAVSHAADGRGPQTLLKDLILEHLQLTDSRELLSALARAGDVRSALASLAPLVTQAAEQGDAVALAIVAEASRQLAALVGAAVATAELGKDFPLALAGGVMTGSSLIREAMLAELVQHSNSPTSVEIVDEPVRGCLRLARRELAAI